MKLIDIETLTPKMKVFSKNHGGDYTIDEITTKRVILERDSLYMVMLHMI
jgi:hypothetical protein